jgi:mono/diheme cytochrome c family protein
MLHDNETPSLRNQETEMNLSRALLPAFFLVSLASNGPTQEKFNIEAARKLFESKCSLCHQLDRPLRKVKDRDGWRKTVERMESYSSGHISDHDAATITEYLTRVRGAKP